jgi:hypothetical protein
MQSLAIVKLGVTLEINKPELEALLMELQGEGANLDEVLLQSLKALKAASSVTKYQRPAGKKSLAQLFAESPFKGLELDFERSHDTLRSIEL